MPITHALQLVAGSRQTSTQTLNLPLLLWMFMELCTKKKDS
jgi:hypothetical protein